MMQSQLHAIENSAHPGGIQGTAITPEGEPIARCGKCGLKVLLDQVDAHLSICRKTHARNQSPPAEKAAAPGESIRVSAASEKPNGRIFSTVKVTQLFSGSRRILSILRGNNVNHSTSEETPTFRPKTNAMVTRLIEMREMILDMKERGVPQVDTLLDLVNDYSDSLQEKIVYDDNPDTLRNEIDALFEVILSIQSKSDASLGLSSSKDSHEITVGESTGTTDDSKQVTLVRIKVLCSFEERDLSFRNINLQKSIGSVRELIAASLNTDPRVIILKHKEKFMFPHEDHALLSEFIERDQTCVELKAFSKQGAMNEGIAEEYRRELCVSILGDLNSLAAPVQEADDPLEGLNRLQQAILNRVDRAVKMIKSFDSEGL